MWRNLRRGFLAGAAGVTALNAVTYADMVWRGRPASTTPEDSVERIADMIGQPIPGDDEIRPNRLTGLAALSGIATGVGIAVALNLVGVTKWVPRALGPLFIGGAAMAATDTSMARLGVSDPRKWSPSDWLADAVPHLAYGLVTWSALRPRRRRA
jgi:hypothetical protein